MAWRFDDDALARLGSPLLAAGLMSTPPPRGRGSRLVDEDADESLLFARLRAAASASGENAWGVGSGENAWGVGSGSRQPWTADDEYPPSSRDPLAELDDLLNRAKLEADELAEASTSPWRRNLRGTAERLERCEQALHEAAAEPDMFYGATAADATLSERVLRLDAELRKLQLGNWLAEQQVEARLGSDMTLLVAQLERERRARRAAELQRDAMSAELAQCNAELAGMESVLADAAALIHLLRARCAELEHGARSASASGGGGGADAEGDSVLLSLPRMRAAIEAAVAETEAMEEGQRKQRLAALRLRWHPDRNPVLQELATEVSKTLNAAIDASAARLAAAHSGDA